MISLESLCYTSSGASHVTFIHEGIEGKASDIHARPSRALISKLIKLLLPIQLSTIYSPKRQELLFSLLHYYPVLESSLQLKIKEHVYRFLQSIARSSNSHLKASTPKETSVLPGTEETFIWIDACESGFFHRFIRSFLELVHSSNTTSSRPRRHHDDEEGERFVAVLVEIFRGQIVQLKESRARKRAGSATSHQVASSSERSEEDFAQRNRLIAIQDFLHLIGTTSQRLDGKGDDKGRGISWLRAIDCVADVGSLSLGNLRLDTEFSCAYMIRQLIAMRAILADLLHVSATEPATLTEHRQCVERFSEVAERLLLQREKGFYRKSLEEVALVVLMTSAQLLQDRSIVFVAQSTLAYFQCYGHKAVVDGLLTTLVQRHAIDYDVHLTHFASDVIAEDDALDADSVLTYHHLLEVERLLAVLVTTLLTYVRHEVADVIDALDILCAFLLRQLGCLFEAIHVDLSFPTTNTTRPDHPSSSPSSSTAVVVLTKKIFRHLVSVLTMNQTIRSTSHSADLIAHAEHLLSSSNGVQATSSQGHAPVTSPLDQLLYYVRDKISLLLQSLKARHVSHLYVTATSSATTSFHYSSEFDRDVILVVLHLLLLSHLCTSSDISDVTWLLQELTHFADETDFPPLTHFITRLHVTLLLDFQQSHSMTSASVTFWKTSVTRLLDYLWMRLDGSLGRLFGLMDGDSLLAASQVAYVIQSFDAHCDNLAALISTALSALSISDSSDGADVMQVREVEGFCLPFLNLWICFILRCFSVYESSGRGQRLYLTYRANAVLSVTESCFHVIDKIFQYQQHLSHATSSSTTSYYEEVSLTSVPAWKWLLRFWLLLDVCDVKFSDLWSQRIRLQSYVRSFSRYTMPLYVGQKTLVESTSVDVMSEYIASDKEILSILSLCSHEEVALYSQSCAAVMTNATFDVYFAVVYHMERRRILFNREIRACVVLFIEALSWPRADKRRMAQKMFTDLQELWLEEMRLALLQTEGDGSDAIFQHLSEQMFSLLHYCFDVREEVRVFCQRSLLALLPLLPSPFLLGKVNLLPRLLNCAFHLETIYEDLLTSSQGSGSGRIAGVLSGTSSTADVIRTAFTTFLTPSEVERRGGSESDVMFSKMPEVVYPGDEKAVLEVLCVNFSLLYVILRRNLQLSELVKREQLKDFLTSHHQRQQHSLNETVLLVQEYLNQRVHVTIHTNAARQVHQVRQRAKQAAAATSAATNKGGEEVVAAARDVNVIFPEAGKSAESILFVTEQTALTIERSVAQSLFSTRSSLRKQLRHLLATPPPSKGASRERALQSQKLYDLLVAYRTIVFHHHPSYRETVALDKKDFLFFLHIASRFIIEQSSSVAHFEDVIDSLDRLVTHYPLYRANVLSIVLASLQTSLFSAGFSHQSYEETVGSEPHQQRPRQQQDFSRVIDFLRRMLQLRDAGIADVIRQFVQNLVTHSLHHLTAASSSPDVMRGSVLTSYSNLYATTALALSILQHSATSMAEEGEQQHLLHLLDPTTHAYRITVRHHSLLREKTVTLLLAILQTQLDRGDSLTDCHVSMQQQHLLETMHYLTIDSRRWRLEQLPRHPPFLHPSEGVEREEAVTEMADDVAMMCVLFPHSLFSLPFTTSARFHHSRVTPSLPFSVVLTLAERIQAASLCGRRHGLEEGKEEGDDDHTLLYSVDSWKNLTSLPAALSRLSGVSGALTLLYSHLLDRYQASATSSNTPSSASALTRGLKFQLPTLTSATFTAIHCNESLFAQSMKACWMTSARLTSLLYRLSFDRAVQQERRRQRGSDVGSPSAFASFLSLAAIHHPLFSWSADHFLGCVEALTSTDTSTSNTTSGTALRDVLDTLPATSRLSEIFTVLARRQHTSATSTSIPETDALLRVPQLLRYFLRSIEQMPLTQVSFYLPQLVQSLRRDFSCHLTHAIALLAETSPQLCHEVTWCLSTESKQLMRRPNHYGFCFELSGVDPLPAIARALQSDIMQRLSELDQHFLVEEVSFFDAVTRISGDLREVKDKEQHPRVIKEFLTQLRDPNPSKLNLSKTSLHKLNMPMPIYMPTKPGRRVLAIDYDSAAPMQSAAKCPFLLRFITEDWEGPDAFLRSLLLGGADEGSDDGNNEEVDKEAVVERWRRGGGESQRHVGAPPPSTPTTSSVYFADDSKETREDANEEVTRVIARTKRPAHVSTAPSPAPATFRTPKSAKVPPKSVLTSGTRVEKARRDKKTTHFDACIFKVYDDCRQDILTLQVVRLLQQYYDVIHLPVFLAPYAIISNRTGDNGAIGGILQVIPSVHSRDQLGKSGFKTLKQYYVTQFGPPSSPAYQKAVKAFIASLAAYNVICYLMHIKDRHNGNILIDTDGHVIHIDFGFILGISPGGNLGFETAAFKFSHEMLELLGGEGSEGFTALQALTVQAFLAARQIKESILALVNAFADSDLPCFQYRKDTLERLYEKFFPSLSESEAAEKMIGLVRDAMHNSTTSMYDGIQKLQNNIYSAEWK